MSWSFYAGTTTLVAVTLYAYIRSNDKKLWSTPARALKVSPRRITEEDVEELKERMNRMEERRDAADAEASPKTGRRYIVVGGAGFLGGWIVIQLLQRGEDPKNIRVLDIRLPARRDLKYGIGKDVEYLVLDVSDREAVKNAFKQPWPDADACPSPSIPITIFHTAANIRFYERSASLLHHSTRVNVDGTQNIIDAALEIGASTLIYTSSGSVGVRASRFLLWPWEKEPNNFVQNLNDDDALLPKKHSQFFSNYAYSKYLAEKRVRKADKSASNSRPQGYRLRTGCIRPGNGIFGPGGDMLCGAYLVRQTNPTWISNIVSHFVYVENCAAAHLCYEQRLIEIERQHGLNSDNADMPSPNIPPRFPDIGGQAFTIADPGPPPTYGDVYLTLETLTNGQTFFPEISPTLMIFIAYIIEWYYLLRAFLLSFLLELSSVSSGVPNKPLLNLFSKLMKLSNFLLPPVNKDFVNLQPSLFNLTMVHLIFDDSRARMKPEQGGLGYQGRWNTAEGLWKTWDAHWKEIEMYEKERKEGVIRSDNQIRSDGAGVSFGFGMVRAQRGVSKVVEKVQRVEEKVQRVETKFEEVTT
ncbi:hypothetical protein C8J55DRAFT_463627 [Lentinula edodes]|uniref:3-beta hydroxysteroid dehydrogenase/isomerase domain-containing protein n=1 Tax=Lentinula lateritia TaxID=40482 RepID=A0A9W8ZQA3_9AGAR|nr:hypothetical protein C8J55DRAFT_463627 [Lentinula edodes]